MKPPSDRCHSFPAPMHRWLALPIGCPVIQKVKVQHPNGRDGGVTDSQTVRLEATSGISSRVFPRLPRTHVALSNVSEMDCFSGARCNMETLTKLNINYDGGRENMKKCFMKNEPQRCNLIPILRKGQN